MKEDMKKFDGVDHILNYAIQREEEAVLFYLDLAARTTGYGLQDVFKEFAEEEKGHKRKLEDITHRNKFP